MYFLETSAKEAENVERLFMEIAAELMEVGCSSYMFGFKLFCSRYQQLHIILASTQ